jgi:hypothetical protein
MILLEEETDDMGSNDLKRSISHFEWLMDGFREGCIESDHLQRLLAEIEVGRSFDSAFEEIKKDSGDAFTTETSDFFYYMMSVA